MWQSTNETSNNAHIFKRMYRVNEIFYSLQGEGYWTGTAAVFVRFSGCNLRCEWCDTEFESYVEMSADEIKDRIARFVPLHDQDKPIIVLTGGEPSLQIDEALIACLRALGMRIHVETNGTRAIAGQVDWITVSPKHSSVAHGVLAANEVKVVYTGQDVEPFHQIAAEHYFLQPCDQHGQMNIKETIDYIQQHPWWRLSIQTHKLLHIK